MFSCDYPPGLKRRLEYGNYVRNCVFPQLRRDLSLFLQGIRIDGQGVPVPEEANRVHDGISLHTLRKNSIVFVKQSVECSICYENDDEIIRKLSCGHEFHLNCIDTWLSTRRICPYCRRVFF